MGEAVPALFYLSIVLGLVVGSFLNVVIHRLPRGQALSWPPSACPRCGRRLSPGELVPLLSFILLRGRCRGCGAPISWRYPAVEALTALLFAAVALRHPQPGPFLFYGWLAAMLVAAAFIDLEHRLIPNRLLAAGLAGGALLLAWARPIGFVEAAGGFGVAGAVMLLIALASRGGMGGGDVKLAAVSGFFLGPGLSLLGLLLGFTAGGLVALGLLASGRKGRKDEIAFGPFLAAGFVAALLGGGDLWRWYLGRGA